MPWTEYKEPLKMVRDDRPYIRCSADAAIPNAAFVRKYKISTGSRYSLYIDAAERQRAYMLESFF